MTTKKIGNLLLDDANLTAERVVGLQDRTGTIADLQNIQDAAADKPSYKFNNSCEIQTANNAQLSMGSGAFSIIAQIRIDSYNTQTGAGICGQIVHLHGLTPSNKYCIVGMVTAAGATKGNLVFYDFTTVTVIVFDAYIFGANHNIVVGRDASYNIFAYMDGVKANILTGNTTVNTTYDMTDTYLQLSEATAGYGMIGQVYRSLLLNYALDATKIARYSDGAKLAWEDVGGSMFKALNLGCAGDTDLVDTTPSDGVADGWTNANGTPTINTTAGSGWGTERRQQISLSSQRLVIYSNSYVMEGGKTYTISFDYTNTLPNTLVIQNGLAPEANFTAMPANVSSKTTYSVTGVWNRPGLYEFQIVDSTAGGTGVVQIRNLQIKQLGAVLDLEPEGIGEGIWADSSTNKLHGTVTSALTQFPSSNDPTTTWLPTITAGTNVAAVGTASGAKYRVTNGICHFEFNATIDVTAAAPTASTVTFTLPIAAKTTNINGSISSATNIGRLTAVAAAGTASWYCTNDTANVAHVISGSYFI